MNGGDAWVDREYRDGIDGLFFKNPIGFVKKNGISALTNPHAYQYLPFASNRDGFDRIVCGSNPVLSALIAIYYIRRRGERLAISVPHMAGFWGYEFLDEPQCYYLIADLLELPRSAGPGGVYRALYKSLFNAVSSSGSLVVSPSLYLGQAVLCGGDEIVTISAPVRSTGFDFSEAQLYQMSLYKVEYRVLSPSLRHETKYSGFSCGKYVLTEFDCGYLLPSRRVDGDVGVEYDARFSSIARVGSAAGMGGAGENYIQRVLADLVAVRRLYETGELVCDDLYLWNR